MNLLCHEIISENSLFSINSIRYKLFYLVVVKAFSQIEKWHVFHLLINRVSFPITSDKYGNGLTLVLSPRSPRLQSTADIIIRSMSRVTTIFGDWFSNCSYSVVVVVDKTQAILIIVGSAFLTEIPETKNCIVVV